MTNVTRCHSLVDFLQFDTRESCSLDGGGSIAVNLASVEHPTMRTFQHSLRQTRVRPLGGDNVFEEEVRAAWFEHPNHFAEYAGDVKDAAQHSGPDNAAD